MELLEMLKKDIEYANYTFQDAEETRDRTRLPFVPEHKADFGLNMGITKYINANLHAFVSGRRPGENGDTRGSMPSYALVDFTLIGKNFMDSFEIRGSVQNLFDKDYDDPAPLRVLYLQIIHDRKDHLWLNCVINFD